MNLSSEIFQADCKHWEGSKPCEIQRQVNRPNCLGCDQYEPAPECNKPTTTECSERDLIVTAGKIGIVEMGGLGSILRTTAVTKAIKSVNPHAQINWFTHQRGVELLGYVPEVDPINIKPSNSKVELYAKKQDLIINFEMSELAKQVILKAIRVYGFNNPVAI